MDDFEIKKRLYDFSDYLDKMNPSINKGILSNFLVGYMECYKKLTFMKKFELEKDESK